MPKKLKLVFYVEDEAGNVVVDKSQTWMLFPEEMLEKAESFETTSYLPTEEGLKQWDQDNKSWSSILDVIDAGQNIMKRFVRSKIIDWVKKQRVPQEG